MTTNKFDHLEPEEADFYGRMTEVMKRTFDTDDDNAANLADSLIEHGVLNPYRVFDRPNDTAALQRIDRALLEVSRALSALTEPAQALLHQKLLFGPFYEKMPIESATDEGRTFEEYLNDTGEPDFNTILRVEHETNRLKNAAKAASKHINKSPNAKRVPARLNSFAVGLVGACRLIWKIETGKCAPKSGIQEGTFARFLADVFEVCDVEASPRAAFAAWVKEREKTPQ